MRVFKRIVEFTICLMIVSIFIYAKPVMSSKKNIQKSVNYTVSDMRVQPSSLPYHELNTTGLSHLIGKTDKEILAEFPRAEKKWQSANGLEWYLVGDSLHNFYEIGIADHVVRSIFVLGDQLDTEPFQIGMTLSDISEITTIFSNFSIEYGDQTYHLELTEDDMNYRPLVAFNNGSFAVLHINQESGKLMSIRYFDKYSLLEQFSNQLEEKKSLTTEEEAQKLNWQELDEDNLAHFLFLINLLGQRDKKHVFKQNTNLNQVAEQALSTYLDEPKKVLKGERLQLWQELEEQDSLTEPFLLTEDEMQKLIELNKTEIKKLEGIFYYPVVDIPTVVTNLYGNRYYHENLLKNTRQEFGVSFNQKNLLMIIGPEEKPKKTIGSSELNQ
ncbi:CAP-associated domain-containing protein [Vagococcus sp.]|uniref:CAP-associated domain-containing protein n=1 Tax=Vagococcus sp. TaxID=1933889 RepID=UPI003F979B7B